MPRPLSAVLLLLIASQAAGQGSREDYQRAATLRGELPEARNADIRAVWLDAARLIHRIEEANDTWRFVHLDAAIGTRMPAFDHAEVARVAEQAFGAPIDPRRLPLERFIERDGVLIALLGNAAGALRIDTDSGAIEPVALTAIAALRVETTAARRSRDRGGETSVLFANDSSETVEIHWVDRGGRLQSYGTLEPGERRRQHTFAGHVWQIIAEDGSERGRYVAGAEPGVVLIGPEDVPASRPAEPEEDAPAGHDEVKIEEHNVVLVDRETGARVALSEDGTAEARYVDRFAWSPDGAWLAIVQREPAQQHTVHIVEARPDDQVQPKLLSFDYLKPGDRIDRDWLVLFDVPNRRRVAVSRELFPNPWSLTRLHWAADGSELFALYNERGHQRLRVLAISRSGAVRTVVDEQSETFIDYAGKLYLEHLEDEGALLWMSERDGWNHLYLVDRASGDARQLTRGDWLVRSVEHVDRARREITFRALGVYPEQDPYQVHYGRVPFDGGPVTWLTEGDGTHELTFSPDRRWYVDRWSRVDLAPVHELRSAADGALVAVLARGSEMPLRAYGWRPPERFVAKGRDGATDIWGVLFYPSNFDPARRYPVIENIYAGPHGHFVPKAFRAWHGSREMAELGFIVVRIDGMGTNWRSKAFHDVCWRNLGDSGFADRIAWIRAAAAERPFMDLSRVGIYGGSAGGQSALRALLAHGDFYHAAVADCGCHDNRMDKVWWNELWMGWPIGPHYAEQSNVTQAHKLTGKLLLIVGALDRNVDPASTMQVVDALIEADKDFDLLVMPGAGHGAAETRYGRRRRQDFFVRHLLERAPRWESDEVTTRTTGR